MAHLMAGGGVLNYKPKQQNVHMSMLSHKSTYKKPIGFSGANNKLREVFNDIDYEIDDPNSISSKAKPIVHRKIQARPQQRIIIFDNVKLQNCVKSESESEDIEESSVEESRDGEDLTIFCKRISKMALQQMVLDKKRQNDKLAKKISAQTKLKEVIMTDFKSKIKENIHKGKTIIYKYTKDQMCGSYAIYDLLMESGANNLLKQIIDEIVPFRLFHYCMNDVYQIEVTWSVSSIKDPTGPCNRIKEIKAKKKELAALGPPPPSINLE